MKILLFAASFPPPSEGGSVEYLVNIVSNLPKDTVVVHTGNLYPLEAAKFDRVFPQRVVRSRFILHVLKVYYTGNNPLYILGRKLERLREYILWPFTGFGLIIRERPDIIYVGEQNFAAVAAWFGYLLLGIPYVYFTYAEEITMLYKRPLHKCVHLAMLRRANKIVTVSEYTRSLLVKEGIASDRIVKIIPAVGHQKIQAVTSTQISVVRKKYNLTPRHRVLLTVGSLTPRKGHTTVLDALLEIKDMFPDVRYVIAGGGALENQLKQQVIDAGLTEQVIFAGRVDDGELSCLYEICEVFVMPHRQVPDTLDTEGCPTVFLEASAHGKPVIGGNAGGVADAILAGSTGYTIDGTDRRVLTHTICHLLSNPGVALEMGKAGQEYVSTLTPEGNAARLWKISGEIHQNCLLKRNIPSRH